MNLKVRKCEPGDTLDPPLSNDTFHHIDMLFNTICYGLILLF